VKCCEGEEGDDGDRKQVYTYFGKKVLESLSRLSDNESKLVTNKTLGYEVVNCHHFYKVTVII